MLLWRKRMASVIFHSLLTLDISNSLIRIRIDYDAIRQKYLHTVHFPSLSIVLNLYLSAIPLSASTQFGAKILNVKLFYSQKTTSASCEADTLTSVLSYSFSTTW